MANKKYELSGYLHLQNFFIENELEKIEPILLNFHRHWMGDNEESYKKASINSHSLTSGEYISKDERLELFKFISQDKIQKLVDDIFPGKAKFLNTQLFFNPFNSNQNNYWHRDIQYNGWSIEEQQEKIRHQNVLHFRIPLQPEMGVELIPKSHREWDLQEEFDVRMSLNNKKPSDQLKRGKLIALNRLDMLIFSANMIHRGIYGKERFTFDIIFCDAIPEFRGFIDKSNLPSVEEIKVLDTEIFNCEEPGNTSKKLSNDKSEL